MAKREGFDSEELLTYAGKAYEHRGVKFRRCLLTFDHRGNWFVGATMRPFAPSGIAVWGCPPGATVQFYIGTDLQGMVSIGSAPARFFAMGDNFEQIHKLLDSGKEPPTWVDWSAVDPGVMVRVDVRDRDGGFLGPKEGVELVMWGTAIVG